MRKALAMFAALVGLFASSYLTWAYTSSTHRMVCMGTGCDEVRASKYAHLFGLPLPVFGLAFYALLIALILLEARPSRHSVGMWRLILALGAWGVLFSGWLTYLEGFVIHAWCDWCVTQAIGGAVAFLLALTIAIRPPKKTRPALGSQLALVAVAVLIGAPALLAIIHRESSHEQDPGRIADSSLLIRSDSHAAGPKNAPLVIVEFADFQCPSCAVAERTGETVRAQYAGQVRFIFRQFPLEKVHQSAMRAAIVSECAAEQGRFWPVMESLYAHQSELGKAVQKKYGPEDGLDEAKFSACVQDPHIVQRIRRDQADGRALGIDATPTFFLNGKKIVGVLSLFDVQAALKASGGKPVQAAATSTPATNPTVAAVAQAKPAKSASPQRSHASAADTDSRTGTPLAFSKPLGQEIKESDPFAQLGPGAAPSAIVPCGVNETSVQDPPMIHVADARKLVESGSAIFIDVRGSGAFKEGHIPSARNVTLDQLEQGIPASLPKDKAIVFYEAGGADESCATSRTAGRILMQSGFKDVRVFKEGLEGWKKEGGILTK